MRSDHASIDYLDDGLGDPALLLLPEWCATRAAFELVRPLLSTRRRVLSLDWRGHGGSGAPPPDGIDDLTQDAVAVVADSGAQSVVPVALAQAGWMAVELRRRLGDLVPGLVVVDWMVSRASPQLLMTLEELRSAADRDEAIAAVLQEWQAGVPSKPLASCLADMGAVPGDLWERAASEIESCYARYGSPLAALAGTGHAPPVLHLVPAGSSSCIAEREQAYAAEHHWYHVAILEARSHFPLFEAPRQAAEEIERFVERVGGRRPAPRST
ncbi:MAG: alpha/beta hydrolase [Actinobacteria bacterium]|nr:alpha/beta hydrolase [Actinomycetota bacterium]